MDLSFLIPSKMRRQVLEYFITRPEAQVYVNELARELKAAPQPVYRELINLENWGFLFSFKRGNQRVFRVNKRFVYFKMLADIFSVQKKIAQSPPVVTDVYNWKDLARQYDAIPIPQELDQRLKEKRLRPRAYTEEIMMKRKGLL